MFDAKSEEEKNQDKDASSSKVTLPIDEKGITIERQNRVSMIDKLRVAIGLRV